MKRIISAGDAVSVVKEQISHNYQEEVFLLCLNGRNDVKSVNLVGLGSDSSVTFPVKAIARIAILDVARSVIIAHTHPNNDSRPSAADIKETERLRSALALFDISLMDHIIISPTDYYSFADESKTEL